MIGQGGKTVERIEGAKAAELSNAVAKSAKGVANGAVKASDGEVKQPIKDLNARLKALIESAPVMVFIKGTPQQVSTISSVMAFEGSSNPFFPS